MRWHPAASKVRVALIRRGVDRVVPQPKRTPSGPNSL
jgi:hypothetical protein